MPLRTAWVLRMNNKKDIIRTFDEIKALTRKTLWCTIYEHDKYGHAPVKTIAYYGPCKIIRYTRFFHPELKLSEIRKSAVHQPLKADNHLYGEHELYLKFPIKWGTYNQDKYSIMPYNITFIEDTDRTKAMVDKHWLAKTMKYLNNAGRAAGMEKIKIRGLL